MRRVICICPASSTHLILAFLFLGLATVLLVVTGSSVDGSATSDSRVLQALKSDARIGVMLVLLQSLVGAVVRHVDAGMACGRELLTCRGGVFPSTVEPSTLLHFGHRILGVGVAIWILRAALRAARLDAPPHIRRLQASAAGLVLFQIGLGFLSVSEYLGVIPVSLHTVGAALLFAIEVAVATRIWNVGRA